MNSYIVKISLRKPDSTSDKPSKKVRGQRASAGIYEDRFGILNYAETSNLFGSLITPQNPYDSMLANISRYTEELNNALTSITINVQEYAQAITDFNNINIEYEPAELQTETIQQTLERIQRGLQ